MNTQRVPLRPDLAAITTNRNLAIVRGIAALARHARPLGDEASRYAAEQWPNDRVAQEIATRATVSITSTASAPVLVQSTVSDLVSIFRSSSCIAQVFAQSLQLRFDSSGQIVVQNYTADGSAVGFFGQGLPYQQKQLDLSSTTSLTPQKLGLGFSLTREQAESGNSQSFITSALQSNCAQALDALALDDQEGTEVRPAGLRYNKAKINATAGGGVAALIGDLAALAAAVDGVSGTNIIYITSLPGWIRIKSFLPGLPVMVLPSGGVEDDELICIAPDALAVCGSGEPIRIERSIQTAIHMEDTSPAAFATVGTPNTVAAPIRSMWQTDCVAIRLIADITWGLRSTDAIAWTDTVTW